MAGKKVKLPVYKAELIGDGLSMETAFRPSFANDPDVESWEQDSPGKFRVKLKTGKSKVTFESRHKLVEENGSSK